MLSEPPRSWHRSPPLDPRGSLSTRESILATTKGSSPIFLQPYVPQSSPPIQSALQQGVGTVVHRTPRTIPLPVPHPPPQCRQDWALATPCWCAKDSGTSSVTIRHSCPLHPRNHQPLSRRLCWVFSSRRYPHNPSMLGERSEGRLREEEDWPWCSSWSACA